MVNEFLDEKQGWIDAEPRIAHSRGVLNTPFSLFLALRYLKPKRSFVSIITVLSITGVVIGIAALIVVIAVMTGFGLELKKKIIGFEPHLRVEERGATLKDWESVREQALKSPGVTAASPIVSGPVIMEFQEQLVPARMLGERAGDAAAAGHRP